MTSAVLAFSRPRRDGKWQMKGCMYSFGGGGDVGSQFLPLNNYLQCHGMFISKWWRGGGGRRNTDSETKRLAQGQAGRIGYTK